MNILKLKFGRNLFHLNIYHSVIIIGILLQFANIGIVTTIISKFIFTTNNGLNSSLVSTINLIGISIAGIFLSRIIKKYQGSVIGICAPVISSFLVILMIFIPNKILLLYSLIFLLSLIMGMDNPNTNSVLNNLIKDKKSKEKYFSKYTTYIQLATILSPVISSWFFLKFGEKISYLFYSIVYILVSFYWIFIKDKLSINSMEKIDIKNNFFIKYFSGYYFIIKNKNLIYLTLSRIISNFVFTTGTIILLPYFAIKFSSKETDSVKLQSILMSFISLGFVISGYIFSNLLSKKKIVSMKIMVSIYPIIAYASILLPFFKKNNNNVALLILMSIGLGFSQFYFRLSGMLLGQAITPPDKLAEVILSGDTIVRLITAIYSMVIIFFTYKYNSLSFLYLSSLLVIISPFFLKNLITEYDKQK